MFGPARASDGPAPRPGTQSHRKLSGPKTSWPARLFLPEPDPAGAQGWSWRRCSLPDGLFGGLARLSGVVGQDARLPVLPGAGARPLALRSVLHRIGSARRVGVASRRQLRVPGLGRAWAARLLHPGDAEQAQREAQGNAHGHGPCGPQHRQQQRCPHGARTAGPSPGAAPEPPEEAPRGRDRGGGGSGGPGPSGWPAPTPPSRAGGRAEPPGAAALQSRSGRR